MSTRRDFFKALSIIPAALVGLRFGLQAFTLPVGCDLSMTALQEAINHGTRLNFGRPHTLIIGPENLFPARALLGMPGLPYTKEKLFKREDFLEYVVRYNLPHNTWRVQFEHGIVESQGP
jgi:hypothetical protein